MQLVKLPAWLTALIGVAVVALGLALGRVPIVAVGVFVVVIAGLRFMRAVG